VLRVRDVVQSLDLARWCVSALSDSVLCGAGNGRGAMDIPLAPTRQGVEDALARECDRRRSSTFIYFFALIVATELTGAWLMSAQPPPSVIEAMRLRLWEDMNGMGYASTPPDRWWWAVDVVPNLTEVTQSMTPARYPARYAHWLRPGTDYLRPQLDLDRSNEDAQPGPPHVPRTCGACVLDPLVYPDIFCSPLPLTRFNGTIITPSIKQLSKLEPLRQSIEGDKKAGERLQTNWDPRGEGVFSVLAALPRGMRTRVGVLASDPFLRQALDAIACELRHFYVPEFASFVDWEVVRASAGQPADPSRPRYRLGEVASDASLHGPRWHVLHDERYEREHFERLLANADVAIVSLAPPPETEHDSLVTPGYASELAEVFARLQAHATSGHGKMSIFHQASPRASPQQLWTQATPRAEPELGHGPILGQVAMLGKDGAATKLRDSAQPPAKAGPGCRCMPRPASIGPSRLDRLLRNLSASHSAVRVLWVKDFLAPRYGWHHQDCSARVEARQHRLDEANGPRAIGVAESPSASEMGRAAHKVSEGSAIRCDCTRYCYSQRFWRVWLQLLLETIRREFHPTWTDAGPTQRQRVADATNEANAQWPAFGAPVVDLLHGGGGATSSLNLIKVDLWFDYYERLFAPKVSDVTVEGRAALERESAGPVDERLGTASFDASEYYPG
jgi:hypothetical protein